MGCNNLKILNGIILIFFLNKKDDERSQFSVTIPNIPVIYTDEPVVNQKEALNKSSSPNEVNKSKSKSKSSSKSLSKSPSPSKSEINISDVECKASDKLSTTPSVKSIGRRSHLTDSDMEIEKKTITSGKRSRASSVSSAYSKRSSSSDSSSEHDRKRFRSDSFDSNRLKAKSKSPCYSVVSIKSVKDNLSTKESSKYSIL